MKIKQYIYTLLPRPLQKVVKSIYFDGLIYPLYKIRYRFHYGAWDFFDSIAIETTTYCNLRCKNCPNSLYDRGTLKNRKLMNMDIFKKIVNELAEVKYNGKILLHFYGEPLTDERLPSLVRYVREKLPESTIHLNTNGFLLTVDIYKKLIEAGASAFLITQYGEKMPKNVKKLFDYLKASNFPNKIKYRVLGKDIALSNRGGELKIKKSTDYDRPVCTYPDNSVIIDYLGNIVLCCNDYHSSIKFGNLRGEKLVDIWNKASYKNLRKEVRKGIFKLPICRKCVGLE